MQSKISLRCQSYREKQSSLFVMYQNQEKQTYLDCYLLDYTKFQKKSPSSLFLWSTEILHNPILHTLHPSVPFITLIHPELCRVHYYTHQKLSKSTVNLNIPSCQFGTYSPYGDKLILCSGNLVWVVDAYIYEVVSTINVGLGLGGISISTARWTIKGVSWTGWDKFVIECSGSGGSCYMQLQNYKKAKLLFQTFPNSYNGHDRKSNKSLKQFIPQSCSNYSLSCSNFQVDYINNILVTFSQFSLTFYSTATSQLISNFVLPQKPSCVVLNKQIQVLFVGTTKGTFFIFKWPQICKKKSKISPNFDQEVLAQKQIHRQKIVQIKIVINYRFIIIVSESGELSIIQFRHQNSHNLSNRAILTLLKKSNAIPNTQVTLTSFSCEARRAEAIVKVVGKQVQINKRNQKIYEQMVQKCQQNARSQKIQTQIRITDEIQASALQKKIKSLLKGIEKVTNELKCLPSIKQSKISEQNQTFEERFLKIFKEKDQLQQALLSLKQKFKHQKEKLSLYLQQQKQSTLLAQEAQLLQTQFDTANHKELYNKMHSYNIRKRYSLDQTKQQTKQMIESEFSQQLHQLNERKNHLHSSIRKHDQSIFELKEKISQCNSAFGNLKDDLKQILNSVQERYEGINGLKLKVKQNESKNQQLGEEIRCILGKKQKTEKNANLMQSEHQRLQKQIEEISAELQKLQKDKDQLDSAFYEQNRVKIYLASNLQKARQRITELRTIRDQIKREVVLKSTKVARSLHLSNRSSQNQRVYRTNPGNYDLLKKQSKHSSFQNRTQKFEAQGLFKTQTQSSPKLRQGFINKKADQIQNKSKQMSLHKDAEADSTNNECLKTKQTRQQQYVNIGGFEQKIAARNYANEKLQKINKIKNDKIKKYVLINNKLINDHKRLISQLNELKRYNDQLIKKQEKLKLQIQNGSFCISKKQSILKKASINSMKNSKFIQKNDKNNQSFVGYAKLHKNGDQITGKAGFIVKKGMFSLHQNGKISYEI